MRNILIMKKNVLFISCLLLIVVFYATGCVIRTTGPTEIGVRTRKIGIFGKKGVENKLYSPGSTYFFLPFINDWHTFDTKLYNMEMTFGEKTGDVRARDDLLFKTIDGNDISLDVIVSLRVNPDKGPYIVRHVARDDHELRQVIIRAVARSKPRDIFGELKTEQFYVAAEREKKSQEAKDILNEILNPYGVIVERVLTQDYRFPDKYEKAIEEKKIAEQRAEKNKSETRSMIEEYKKRVKEAEGEVNKNIAKVDGQFRQAKIEADAYFEKQKLIAEAIIAEGEAEAEGITKMNEALAGSGGEILVKLEMAKRLKGKRIILLPVSSGNGIDLKTTDINDLLKVYGVQKMSLPQGSKSK